MIAWQIASAPFWIVGFTFCVAGFLILIGYRRRPADTTSDLIGQSAFGLIIGLLVLIIAAWMVTP